MQCQNSKKDCFGNKNGACRVLSNTKFTKPNGEARVCPFYKKKSEES